jgi:hypothetical protein
MLCLLAKGDAASFLVDDFLKVLLGVCSALRDDFTGAALPFGLGQASWTLDRADSFPHVPSLFLLRHIHPPPNDPPSTARFNVTFLTSSAGHALSSPLNWCRGKNLIIVAEELQLVGWGDARFRSRVRV